MAEKIPSPEEIKGEIKKFTEEEVNTLRSFQSRMEQIVTSLGRVHYSRIKLDDQENSLKKETLGGCVIKKVNQTIIITKES